MFTENQATNMKSENTSPIDCANLFGGPGTGLSPRFNFGTIIRVTNKARGLIFGPEDVLAKKP
jgi:hypothetical protein